MRSGSNPVSTDGEGAPYIQRGIDKPGGSSREQPTVGVPYPRETGESGEAGEPRGQENAAGAGAR